MIRFVGLLWCLISLWVWWAVVVLFVVWSFLFVVDCLFLGWRYWSWLCSCWFSELVAECGVADAVLFVFRFYFGDCWFVVIMWFDLGMLLFRLFLRLFVCFVGWFGFD